MCDENRMLECGSYVFSRKDVCAVVISYNCESIIVENVNSLLDQVAEVLIIDNGSNEHAKKLLKTLECKRNCSVIYSCHNEGISKQLNNATKILSEKEYKLILTMDQDTVLEKNCVYHMINVLNQDRKVVSVGPKRRKKKQSKDYYYKDYLITSGNLVKLDILKEIGGYDEKLFIDMVDIDISLAIRQSGYRLAISNKAGMRHKVGEQEVRKWGGFEYTYLSHNPNRFYSIYHNLIYVTKKYYKKFPIFCIKLCVTHFCDFLKISLENNSQEKYHQAKDGFMNGLKNK